MYDSKGRRQNSLPLTTNFSQNVTEPSKGISYQVGDVCRHFTKLTVPYAYALHRYPIPPTDGTNGLLSLLSHAFDKQVTNVSNIFLSSYCGESLLRYVFLCEVTYT